MWVWHTSVRPRRNRREGEAGNLDHRRELESAYGKFLGSILGNLGDLPNNLANGSYCLVISTLGDDDAIDPESDYHVKFTKSGFLRNNARLQRDLIQRCKPLGVYVGNPQQRDKHWVIEFSLSRNKAKSSRSAQRGTTHSAQSS